MSEQQVDMVTLDKTTDTRCGFYEAIAGKPPSIVRLTTTLADGRELRFHFNHENGYLGVSLMDGLEGVQLLDVRLFEELSPLLRLIELSGPVQFVT